ncbi:MAG: MarR family transcriptional regulator [Clostridia bacterium]
MEAFSRQLNDILVDTFRVILKVEEEAIKQAEHDLSISEVHLLESVGKGENTDRTISDIAENLGITLPSVTIAINKLVKKGYVEKLKSTVDGRMVFVVLTEQGKKMEAAHRFFHERMVRNLSGDLNDEERESLYYGMVKLNAFFKRKLLKKKQ